MTAEPLHLRGGGVVGGWYVQFPFIIHPYIFGPLTSVSESLPLLRLN